MSRRFLLIILLLTVATVGYFSWQFFKKVQVITSPIRIGVITELTGEFKNSGIIAKQGAELALQLELSSGIIGGRQVELVFKDDQSDPAGAVAAVQELANDSRVFAIIGPSQNKLATVVAEEAEKRGVLLLVPRSTDPAIVKNTDGIDKKWVYRVSFSEALQGRALAKYARVQSKTAGILADSGTSVLNGSIATFKTFFQLLGGTIAVEDMFSKDDKDFSSQLKRAKLALEFSDLEFLSAQTADAVRIIKEARIEGVRATFFGTVLWGGEVIAGTCGDVCENLRMAAHFAPDADDVAVKDFVVAYQKKYGTTPEEVAGLNYDAINLALQTITLANGVDQDMDLTREEIATRVGLANIDGVTGHIRYFAGSHDPEKTVRIVEISGGKVRWVEDIEP